MTCSLIFLPGTLYIQVKPRRMFRFVLGLILMIPCFSLFSQEHYYQNPILPGSYPDPSICLVNDTFYMVNSSFEYFPGLPIHKSTDLVQWSWAGNGLHRAEQCTGPVNLVDVQTNGGIHAPSIRYYDGWFYIITTNVYYREQDQETDFVNFIIRSKRAEGPWSEPIVIEGAPGIDPDIFFDDDGKVWYTGTHVPDNPNFSGEGEIWLQELDAETFQLKGERHYLWRGACQGTWAEGPHIYKAYGKYYLLIAEGGTSFNHAVMIAVSDAITGPYVPNDRNPIFTARHLSYDHWVHSLGHADLIQLPDSSWQMVCLGVRGDIDRGSNMGRETHLFPVQWEQEPFEWKSERYYWPVVSAATGRAEKSSPAPLLDRRLSNVQGFKDEFNTKDWGPDWNFRRVPDLTYFERQAKQGTLRIHGQNGFQHRDRSSWVGVRQVQSDFYWEVKIDAIHLEEGGQVGTALVQKDDNYLLLTMTKKGNQNYLQVWSKSLNKTKELVFEQEMEYKQGPIWFYMDSWADEYKLSYGIGEGMKIPLYSCRADQWISKGYTGAYLGLYVEGVGTRGDFDYAQVTFFKRP